MLFRKKYYFDRIFEAMKEGGKNGRRDELEREK